MNGKKTQTATQTPAGEEGKATPVAEMIAEQISIVLTQLGIPTTPCNVSRDQTLRFGDWVSPVALSLAKSQKTSPPNIANQIAEALRGLDNLNGISITVSSPGYLNFTLSPQRWQKALEDMKLTKSVATTVKPKRVLLELVSANPTGALTVGSARNAIFGDALARLLKSQGHDVTTEYYINDAGAQVLTYAKSLRAHALGLEIPEGGYQGDDAKSIAKELMAKFEFDNATPIEQWQEVGVATTLGHIKKSLDNLGVSIDGFRSEQKLHQTGAVEKALAKLKPYLYQKDEATFLKTTQWGDDKDRVVVRSNGDVTYFAADIAYMENKFSRGYERLIYILGVDHSGYVTRMKAAASALGFNPGQIDIQLYELVTIKGAKGGKRLGNMPSVDEALGLTSKDALRWYLSASGSNQTIDLNLEQMEAKSMDNPVFYVQYAHARSKSLIRKALNAGLVLPANVASAPAGLSDEERRLLGLMNDASILVSRAADEAAPHLLVTHLLELARAYSSVYTKLPVVTEQDAARQQWLLSLHHGFAELLADGLSLLGISAPDKM